MMPRALDYKEPTSEDDVGTKVGGKILVILLGVIFALDNHNIMNPSTTMEVMIHHHKAR